MIRFRPLSGYLISKFVTRQSRIKLESRVSVPSRGILFPNDAFNGTSLAGVNEGFRPLSGYLISK